MKQIRLFSTWLFIMLFFSSCYRMVFKSLGILDYSASPAKAHNNSKEIIYIPMHHFGKREFYIDVKNKIDSLRKEGFAIYFEGVRYSKTADSLSNDTLAMKLRYLVGVDFRSLKSQGGYIDTLDGSVMGKKIKAIAKYKLVNQPRNELYDTTVDRRVDAYLSDAMYAFEEKYGKVILTDCDFNTKPSDQYKCGHYRNKEGKNFLLLIYRNDLITKEILKDPHTKIALVYGAKHYKGIVENLQQQDSTWKTD